MLFGHSEGSDIKQMEVLVGAMQKAVIKLIKEKNELLTVKASIEKKPISEFMKKMRVHGLDKFTAPSFVSTVNYYLNEHDLRRNKTMGNDFHAAFR